MRILAWIASAMCLIACRQPRAGAVVVKDADGYVISVFSCGPGEQEVPVTSLEIVPHHSNAEPSCVLSNQDDARRGGLKQWRYGTRLAGYDMTGCAPLKPDSYMVRIESRRRIASAFFETAEDGEVRMIYDGCRE